MQHSPRPWLLHVDALERYRAEAGSERPYPLTENGTAIISIVGPMQKFSDFFMDMFGGASTETIRAAVRVAAEDPEVDGIFLRIDSPGGEVAGTEELADAVHAVRGRKPIHAHVEDLGASAAYWVASQADEVTANSTAEVGSIGTVATIADTSKAWEDKGIQWHVVSSGPYKGLTAKPEVTDETVAYIQGIVDDLTERFVASIRRARKFTADQVSELVGGRVYVAERAKKLGLIDGIRSRDAAFAEFSRRTGTYRKKRMDELRTRGVRRAEVLGAAYRNLRDSPLTPPAP